MLLSPFLILFIQCAFAAPAPQADGPAPADNGTVTHLYMCNDDSFAGSCTNMHLKVSDCVDVPGDHAKQISSAGPDEGTFCTLYSDTECRGSALPFTYPGIKKLVRYGFDDKTTSVRCDFIAGWATHP